MGYLSIFLKFNFNYKFKKYEFLYHYFIYDEIYNT